MKKPPATPISLSKHPASGTVKADTTVGQQGTDRAAFEQHFLDLAQAVITVEQGTQAASDSSAPAPNTKALAKGKARIRVQSLASLKNTTESGLILKPEESADA